VLIDRHGQDSIEVASYLEKEADTLVKSAKYEDAVQRLLEARYIYQKQKMPASEFPLLLFLSKIYLKMNDLSRAIDCLQQYADIRLKVYEKKDQNLAIAYYRIGSIYYEEEDYKQALQYFKSSLEIENNLNIDQGKISLLEYRIASCHYELGNFTEARDSIEKAMPYYATSDDKKATYMVHHLAGLIYESLDDVDESTIQLKKALLAAEDGFREDSYEVAVAQYLLGKNEYRLDRVDQGIKYTKRAFDLFKKNLGDESNDLADASYNLSIMYFKKHEFEKAREYLDLSMNIYKSLGKQNDIKYALALENEGMMLMSIQKTDEALSTFYKAIEAADQVKDDKLRVSRIYLNIAKILGEYFPTKVQDAILITEKVRNLFINEPNSDIYKEADLLLIALHKAL